MAKRWSIYFQLLVIVTLVVTVWIWHANVDWFFSQIQLVRVRPSSLAAERSSFTETCPVWQRRGNRKSSKNSLDTGEYWIPKYYNHRTQIEYFKDIAGSNYQFSVYMFAAEVGRRLHAKYFIDLGCGNGFKLAKLGREFTTIGIDFGHNIRKAKQLYPSLRWLESGFEGRNDCTTYFPVSESELRNSIVVSSDVIEHILKPDRCYMDILEHAARVSKGLVLSTPDRALLQHIQKESLLGPPQNPTHIREWRRSEMIDLLNQHNMYPIRSGWICPTATPCHQPTTMILSLAAAKTLQSPQVDTRESESVKRTRFVARVFLVHLMNTHTVLLVDVMEHLMKQGLDVVLLLDRKDNTQYLDQLGKAGVVIIHYNSTEQISKLITSIANDPQYITKMTENMQGEERKKAQNLHNLRQKAVPDWNILMYSNEWIYIPGGGLGHPDQLGQFLCWLSQQQGDFNAVAVTTKFYMGESKTAKMLVNVFSNITETLKAFRQSADTLQLGIRIWRSGYDKPIRLNSPRKTNTGQEVIGGILKDTFPSLNIYPYNLVLLRVPPPEKGRQIIKMAEIISDEVYFLETNLGIQGVTSPGRFTIDYLF